MGCVRWDCGLNASVDGLAHHHLTSAFREERLKDKLGELVVDPVKCVERLETKK